MVTENVTLDGSTGFTIFGRSYTWEERHLERTHALNTAPNGSDTANFSLTGTDWGLERLHLQSNSEADPLNVSLSDSDTGSGRTIKRLMLSDYGNTTISLLTTFIKFIEGGIGGTLTMTTGVQRVHYTDLFDMNSSNITIGSGGATFLGLTNGNDTLTGGTGYIDAADFRDGNNTYNGNTGGAGYLRFGTGTNTVNTGNSYVSLIEFGNGSTNTLVGGSDFTGTIRSFGANNTFTLTGGCDQIYWDDGNMSLTFNGGFNNSVAATSENFSVNNITINEGAHVRSIGLSNGKDTIVVRGSAEIIQVGANDDRVDVLGNGQVDSLLLGDGNNRFVLDGQWTWAVTAFSGNDTASVNSGQIDQLYLGGGNNTVTVGNGAFVGSLRTNEGTDKLTVDGGDIIQATLGSGKNTVLVKSGHIETLLANEGADKITVQNGEIMSINAMGGNNTIKLGTGYTGFVGTYDGRDSVTLGTGDVFTIGTGSGDDTVDGSAGRFDYLDAGSGNDVVTLGVRGARFVALGDGNDTISVAPFTNPAWGVEVQGDAGTDTVDLSRFASNVTLSLETSAWQEPAVGQGYLAMIGVENAIGGAGGDTITGSTGANVLSGGRGADSLLGGDGNDTLVGGRENDTLTGGAGADTFTFLAVDGRDTITLFDLGADRIELREANSVADLIFTQVVGDVRIDFGALRITVLGTTVAAIDDAVNYLF